jgi:hypothetical protein
MALCFGRETPTAADVNDLARLWHLVFLGFYVHIPDLVSGNMLISFPFLQLLRRDLHWLKFGTNIVC